MSFTTESLELAISAAPPETMSASRIQEVWTRHFGNEIGAIAVDTRGAVEGGDMIAISIPFPTLVELPKDLFDTVPEHVPIFDTGSYPGLRDHSYRSLMLECRIASGWQ